MILVRISLVLGFAASFLMTIGGIGVLRESKRDPDITWSDSSTVFSIRILCDRYIKSCCMHMGIFIRGCRRDYRLYSLLARFGSGHSRSY